MLLFRALASGSSGNAFLLQTDRTRLLFEAGLRLPRLRQLLANEGVQPERLSAILVSHEHTDHCLAAKEMAASYDIPICSNAAVLRATGTRELKQATVIEIDQPTLFGDVEVTCFPVSHDAVRPVGFLIRAARRTIAIATDLGEPTPELLEAVAQADLVVLEANHDLQMLKRGRYPYHLQRRVSGPKGHLSNDQAASILTKHVKGEAVDVWLAHLSRENNTPGLATKTVKRALRDVGLESVALGVASRDRPSLRWTGVPRPRQLSLFACAEIG